MSRNAHDAAVANGLLHYTDPATGRFVFTELGLLNRGECCGSGCRHCPWGHREVTRPVTRSLGDPTWRRCETAGERDVLFWSGGKDSYLSYLALQEAAVRPVTLLTTHDSRTGLIAHQDLHIDTVIAQATALGLDLITVPLSPEEPYGESISRALHVVSRQGTIRRLVFGDLHLTEIRAWREEQFTDHTLHFPLWQANPATLLDRLEASPAEVRLSASPSGLGTVGELFNRRFVRALPPWADPFGENGEFHTVVAFPAQ